MSITLEEAEKLTDAAKAKAQEMGLRVTVSVVDAAGHVVTIHRMDGVGAFSVDISSAMAFTAATFGSSGSALENIQERPWFRALSTMYGGRLVASLGMMPIKRGDEVIGAVGVSGGSAQQDLEIVEAGLAALA